MFSAFVLFVSVVVGESFSGKAKIDGIGEIALPPGKWTLEYVVNPEKRTNNPDAYVFKKEGDRLERLTFQKFGPHIALPIDSYFDSIGDRTSNGIPMRLLNGKSEHDTAHILRPLIERAKTRGRVTCKMSSYIYTGEGRDPWMSHAFVCDRDGWVLVCVHASPHVLSPETVDDVFSDSKFEKGTSEPTEKGRSGP